MAQRTGNGEVGANARSRRSVSRPSSRTMPAMAELYPLPLGRLLRRAFRELDQHGRLFDLPVRKVLRSTGGRDFSVGFHGFAASTPLGPAAGPHSQLAQNIALSFLGGGRIVELKTVQILDRLNIPRPCIDMQTIGYNVEWSQELTLEQSLEEYVKASMLIRILVESGRLGLEPGLDRVIYDMSVGYDLAGIQSERVGAFMDGMMNARATVDRLRAEIPAELSQYRDLDFETELSRTLTLSTFHGCPPEEIERIVDWLMRERRLCCVVKLNPTLLGPKEARGILNDQLGYADRIPDSAFEKDARWDHAVDFVARLGDTARELGLGFGVKLTNTLIVENHRDFFPRTEQAMYLSGKPLHVLAMTLVRRFRRHFGDRFPISFSAGIDKVNFPDAVSLGLVPVTVCSDLLQTGGYARMAGYFEGLGKRMDEVGAATVDELVVRGQAQGANALESLEGIDAVKKASCLDALRDGQRLGPVAGEELWARWVSAARVLNTERYCEGLAEDARYHRDANMKVPRKVGSLLELFDCLTCDKCVPVCPNDANFTYTLPAIEIPVVKLAPAPGGGYTREEGPPLRIGKKHQLATFADFCNECGNCDVFCPEDGGPYVLKPRFFGSREQWEAFPEHDGFFVEQRDGEERILGRFQKRGLEVVLAGSRARFVGEGFDVRFAADDPEGTIEGEATATIDLTHFHIMRWLLTAVLDPTEINYVNS